MAMDWMSRSNEFEKIISRLTVPKVVIDNGTCTDATIVKVDSARKHGNLLETVQVLTDLNLSIKKAYVSSDGRWFMDVFHVTDLNGNRLADRSVMSFMEESLGGIHDDTRVVIVEGMTVLELTGTDRIGLLSEVFAVLSDLECNVVNSKVWTHNGRVASLIYVKDCCSGCEIRDSERIETILARLRPVLKGDNDIRGVRTIVSPGITHAERRLHQLMFADRDYEREGLCETRFDDPVITIQNWIEWGYSVLNIECKDRIKLLFDVVCTLTDMDYVVFHATVYTEGNRAYLEFYIRHEDGYPISSEAEKQRVVQCLQASIKRRASQGVRLELHTEDRPFLLAQVTRTFRENGLNVTGAEISTTAESATNIFYVTDSSGFLPDNKTIEAVRQKIGLGSLKVKELPSIHHKKADVGRSEEGGGSSSLGATVLLSIGSMVRRNLYNLGLIGSYS